MEEDGLFTVSANSSRRLRQQFALYLACYAIWIALSALAFWTTLQLMSAASQFATYYRVNVLGVPPTRTVDTAWQLRGIYQLIALVLILVWLGAIVFLEGYLRDSARQGRLWPRAARILGSLVILLALAYGAQALL